MGGDCSQKLSPGGESHSSPGQQQTSGSVENQHSTSKTFGVQPKIASPTGKETAAPEPCFFFS